MPTYEYQCNDCDIRFEKFQSITAEPIKQCPECGGSVRRLISAGGGLIFKGSGFYTTDYRSEGYKKAEKKEKESSSESKSEKSETKSDSKGESKKSESGGKEAK